MKYLVFPYASYPITGKNPIQIQADLVRAMYSDGATPPNLKIAMFGLDDAGTLTIPTANAEDVSAMIQQVNAAMTSTSNLIFINGKPAPPSAITSLDANPWYGRVVLVWPKADGTNIPYGSQFIVSRNTSGAPAPDYLYSVVATYSDQGSAADVDYAAISADQGVGYFYQVVVFNISGNSAGVFQPASGTTGIQALDVPPVLDLTVGTAKIGQVDLSWSLPTLASVPALPAEPAASATAYPLNIGYNIYRSLTSGSGFELVDTIYPVDDFGAPLTTINYTDSVVSIDPNGAGIHVYYKVETVVNGVSATALSNEADQTTLAIPAISAPSASATSAATEAYRIDVVIPAAVGAGEQEITSYNLYYATSDDYSTYNYIGNFSASTTFNHTALNTTLSYKYVVEGVKNGCVSAKSATSLAATPVQAILTATVPSPTSVSASTGGTVVVSGQGFSPNQSGAVVSYRQHNPPTSLIDTYASFNLVGGVYQLVFDIPPIPLTGQLDCFYKVQGNLTSTSVLVNIVP